MAGAESGPRSHFIPAQRHFVNSKKYRMFVLFCGSLYFAFEVAYDTSLLMVVTYQWVTALHVLRFQSDDSSRHDNAKRSKYRCDDNFAQLRLREVNMFSCKSL